MIMFWPLIFTFVFSAGAKPSQKNSKPIIWTKSSVESVKLKFSPNDYEFRDQKTQAAEIHAEGFLLPREREAVFRKLKLETKLSQMDNLDKDLLVANTRYYSVAELHKQYPMLTTRQLTALKAEVEKIK